MHHRSKPSAIILATAAALAALLMAADTLRLFAPLTTVEPSYTRAVSMERDRRAEPDTFARLAGLERNEFYGRYGASGLVRCGDAVGSGQITLKDDVITTAAHVFIGQGGKMRSEACVFEPIGAAGAVPIDMTSIKTGSSRPMDERATLDWAVARLAMPSGNGVPYRIAEVSAVPMRVSMLGGGHGRAEKIGAEKCAMRHVTKVSPEGVREVAFDCSAAHGGSGAALLNDRNEIVGIFVGYRSVDKSRAQPFSDLHYNFAITVEGPFRQALLQTSRR